MKRIEDLNYYELLSLSESANTNDIHKAYLLAVSTYSKDSLAAYNILSDEDRTDILKRIEAAYSTLIDKNKRMSYDEQVLKIEPNIALSLPHPSAADIKFRKDDGLAKKDEKTIRPFDRLKRGGEPARQADDEYEFKPADSTIFGGSYLKNIREMKGITLDEISQKTRIKISYLKALEDEDFKQLPAEVFARGFLRAYAKYLAIDPEVVSRSYKFKNHNEL
jgi:curved DNA-binding protein CbpA